MESTPSTELYLHCDYSYRVDVLQQLGSGLSLMGVQQDFFTLENCTDRVYSYPVLLVDNKNCGHTLCWKQNKDVVHENKLRELP